MSSRSGKGNRDAAAKLKVPDPKSKEISLKN
jgi:hypothetical protein